MTRPRAPLPQSPAALRWARLAKGWTLRSFARELGVDPGDLSKYETGKRAAPAPVLQRIARVLGCPVTMLQAPCRHDCPFTTDDQR